MAKINLEDAAFAGVALLLRKPGAALAWAALWVIMVALVTIPFAGTLTRFVTFIVRSGRPDTQSMLAMLPGMGAFFILMGLCGLVLGAVISCAVYRAVLEPEDSAFAYLRLGEVEIQVLLVNFVRALVVTAINLGLSFIVGIVLVAAGHAGAGAAKTVGNLIIFAAMTWVQLRFALAGPLTFMERRFRLFEAWTLTRGSVLRLFVVALIVLLIAVVIYLALATLGVTVSVNLWTSAPHPADLQSLLLEAPSEWLSQLAPFVALFALLVFIAGALLTPIGVAPWALVCRSLTGGSADHARP